MILARPPGDSFTFKLFIRLIAKVPEPKNTIYLWSAILDPAGFWNTQGERCEEISYRHALKDAINEDLVVIGVKDHLTSYDFNYWSGEKPTLVEYLDDMFTFYNDKKFILFTSVENLDSYINNPRVTIIPWGGDITNHQTEYQALEPVLDKNLDSQYSYLSLNRNKRSHRAMLLSLLHVKNLNEFGLISCMFKDEITNLFEYTKWKVSNPDIYEQGFNKFKSTELLLNDSKEIYTNYNNDNVSNFRNKLSNYYKETFVEIITETSFTESCYNLTEKTLNSIYGCSFPIVLCGQGCVQLLRDMGMDVFDDVIDHSYDLIADPAERLYKAITDNQDLLSDPTRAKALWVANKQRFEKNVDFAKTRLYTYYEMRAKGLMSNVSYK